MPIALWSSTACVWCLQHPRASASNEVHHEPHPYPRICYIAFPTIPSFRAAVTRGTNIRGLREYYEGCGYCGARFSRSSSSHRGTGTDRGRRIDCASISATRLAARKRPHRPRAHGNRKSSQVAGRSASASAESANAAAARTSKSSILFEPSTHFRSGSVAPPEVWPKSLCRFAPAARVYVVHLAEFAPVRRACGAWRPSRVGHESYRSAAALAALALKAVLKYCTWKCPL